ncbi:MAG: FHA domain-containing protein [Sphaerobacteraceae bacterium]|nr:MAG: FHA domain-containing protein [Sphaerobacteraceae bacterium]
MSTQWILAIIVLLSVVIWFVQLLWIYSRARGDGQDPLRPVSGAAIFFVFAAPVAIALPNLVDRLADFWENIFQPEMMDRFRSSESGEYSVPRLIVAGKTIPLTQDRVQIGRFDNNDLMLDHPTVSAYHAEVILRPDGKYELMDRDSRNGTRINGTMVRAAVLKHGDQITLGALTIHYLVGSDGEASHEPPAQAPPPSQQQP